MKLPGGCRDIVQRFQSVAVVCVRHAWQSLPCPTPAVMVSKSVTSSWLLHCVHFLPLGSQWDLYTFTLGLLLCVRVHAFTGLCVWVCAHVKMLSAPVQSLFPWSNSAHISSGRVKWGLNAPDIDSVWHYGAVTGKTHCGTQRQQGAQSVLFTQANSLKSFSWFHLFNLE